MKFCETNLMQASKDMTDGYSRA